MIKVVEINSEEEKEIKSKDLEIVKVSSERNILTDYKSLTYLFAKELEKRINNSCCCDYKILVAADEGKEKINNLLKVVILVDTKEKMAIVMDSLTQKNYVYDVMLEKPKQNTITPFKKKCQFWSNTIQEYLFDRFNFKGSTKVAASGLNGIVQTFDITIVGKGVNDKIVDMVKRLSRSINQEKFIYYTEEDIYITLDNFLS